MKTLKAGKLKPGDKVGLISPSNTITHRNEEFSKAIDKFEKVFDLEIQIAPYAMGRHWYSSGTTEERLDDFHQMIVDPEIKAVLFSSGGNTAVDLVDKIDYQMVKDNPKIIAGISDGTTLLTAITAKTGLITFLGLEFMRFADQDLSYSIESINKSWFDGLIGTIPSNSKWHDFKDTQNRYKGWQTIRKGKVSGRISGGNLDSFFQLLNTPYQMDYKDTLLVFETYKFRKRRIHQGLAKMRLHGIFDDIAGIIAGYCVGSDEPLEYGNKRSIKDMVKEITEGYDLPSMYIGEIGHYVENVMLPIGAMATIDTGKLLFSIDERVVD